MTPFQVRYGNEWHEQEDGQSINAELLGRVKALANFLLSNDMVLGDIIFNEGLRSRQRAHKMSTSYFLCRKPSPIPLENLQALKDGKDLDGNQWFDPRWYQSVAPGGLPPEDSDLSERQLKQRIDGGLWAEIRKRASEIKPQSALAAEGYPVGDPHILPNTHGTISNHVGGNAIDCHIDWRPGVVVTKYLDGSFGLGKPAWSPLWIAEQTRVVATLIVIDGEIHDPAADCIIGHFGLRRPVPSERWHFQVAANRLPLSVTNLRWRH